MCFIEKALKHGPTRMEKYHTDTQDGQKDLRWIYNGIINNQILSFAFE